MAAFWPLNSDSPRDGTDCKFAGFTPSVIRIHSCPCLHGKSFISSELRCKHPIVFPYSCNALLERPCVGLPGFTKPWKRHICGMLDSEITSNDVHGDKLSLEVRCLGTCILRLSDEFKSPATAFAEMNMIAFLCEEQNCTKQELLRWGEANLKIAKKWSPGVRELTGIPRNLARAEAKFERLRKATSPYGLWPINNTIRNPENTVSFTYEGRNVNGARAVLLRSTWKYSAMRSSTTPWGTQPHSKKFAKVLERSKSYAFPMRCY